MNAWKVKYVNTYEEKPQKGTIVLLVSEEGTVEKEFSAYKESEYTEEEAAEISVKKYENMGKVYSELVSMPRSV